MESQRPCDDGFVCIDHECTMPPPAAPCDTDADCSSATPFCSPDKLCVECLQSAQCPSTAPTCDVAEHACRKCEGDDECASRVCDLSVGVCVPAERILYVSPSGTDVASCGELDPCSIAHAFASLDTARQTIKLAPGSYTASITLSAQTVLVDGYGATVNAAAGQRSFQLDNGSAVKLVGLRIVNINQTNGIGIACETPLGGATPSVTLDEVTVDSADTAVLAHPGSVSISRSRLHTQGTMKQIVLAFPTSSVIIDRTFLDGGDGILADGSASVVRLTNSVIRNQTEGIGGGSNIFGQGAGSMFVSFSTVIDSRVGCGSSATARCAGGTDVGSCLDNTVVYNTAGGAPADTVQGTACTASFCLVFPQSTAISGSNNQYVDPMLVNASGADYHLVRGSPAIDAADPTTTDMIDYDGINRPQGTRSDIGAFEAH